MNRAPTVVPRRNSNPQVTKEKPLDVRPPFPPFTRETAIQKVRLAKDGWNSRDPQKVSLEIILI